MTADDIDDPLGENAMFGLVSPANRWPDERRYLLVAQLLMLLGIEDEEPLSAELRANPDFEADLAEVQLGRDYSSNMKYLMIAAHRAPDWVLGLDPARVEPDFRPVLERYQRARAEALAGLARSGLKFTEEIATAAAKRLLQVASKSRAAQAAETPGRSTRTRAAPPAGRRKRGRTRGSDAAPGTDPDAGPGAAPPAAG